MPSFTVTSRARGSTTKILAEHLAGDLLADVLVRAVEDREHVGPADNADQVAVRVGHREPLDPAVVHELRGLLDRVVRGHGHRRGRHQVTRGHPARLRLLRSTSWRTPRVAVQDFFGQQVGLGDEADHLSVLVDYGQRADPVPAEGDGELPEVASALTAMTRVVMTSLTLALIAAHSLRLHFSSGSVIGKLARTSYRSAGRSRGG